jgi:hypothetical protein
VYKAADLQQRSKVVAEDTAGIKAEDTAGIKAVGKGLVGDIAKVVELSLGEVTSRKREVIIKVGYLVNVKVLSS